MSSISHNKLWQKPELIVIMRNKPEEAVLWFCKKAAITGPENDYSGCRLASGEKCENNCHGAAGS